MLPLRNSSYRVWRVGSLELPLENVPVGVSQWKAEENVGTTDPTTSQDHREKDGCLVKSSIPWSLVSQLLGKLQETPVCQLLRLWQQSFFCCFTSNPYRVDSLIKFQGELQRETFQSCQADIPVLGTRITGEQDVSVSVKENAEGAFVFLQPFFSQE